MAEANDFDKLLLTIGFTIPDGGCKIKNETYHNILREPNPEIHKRICTRAFTTEEDKNKIWNVIVLISETIRCWNQMNVQVPPPTPFAPLTNNGYMVKVYKWPLKIPKAVRNAVERLTNENLYHVGIGVYNTLHHYATDGIKQQLEMPKPKEVEGTPSARFYITRKTRREFDHWLREQLDQFSASNYNFYKNNCIKFAKKLFDFLEVEEDQTYEKVEPKVASLQEWMENEKNIKLLNTVDGFLKFMEAYQSFTQEFSRSCKALLCSKSSSAKRSDESGSGRIQIHADFQTTLDSTLVKIEDDMALTCRLSNTGGIYDIETSQIQSNG